jgi:hypothetical protein
MMPEFDNVDLSDVNSCRTRRDLVQLAKAIGISNPKGSKSSIRQDIDL